MDRLLLLILLALGLGLPGQAAAYGEVTVTTSVNCRNPEGTQRASGGSLLECSRALAGLSLAVYRQYYPDVVIGPVTETSWELQRFGSRLLGGATVPDGSSSSVPANSTCTNGVCTCNGGYEPGGGQCMPYTVPEVGQVVNSNASTKYTIGSNGKACMNGVLAIPRTAYGSEYGVGPWYSLGQSCDPTVSTGGGDAVVEPPTGVCPIGQCPGLVNGNSVCVTCGSVTSNVIASTSSGSGSTATTTSSITSTSVNPTTGVGTETTIVYSGGGGGSGSSISTPVVQTSSTRSGSVSTLGGSAAATAGQDVQPLCAQFPNIPACKYNTASGGCGAFVCDGDPAVCAIARAAHNQRCELVEGTGLDASAKAAYDAAKAAPVGSPSADSTTSMSFTSVISQADLLGGSCPSDTTLSVAGSTLTLPFSQLCSALQMLGAVMVGLSMLAAAFIVFRS